MNNTIKADLYRYGGLTGTKGFIRALRCPGFRFLYIIRNRAIYSNYSFPGVLFKILEHHYKYKYGFQIPYKTSIGEGFYIGHFGTIIINEQAIIGKNCNIAPGVTIGQTNSSLGKGIPTIGDYVWMGTGCTIVGNITIGNNVLIAPNAFVNTDIPDHTLVIGNPAQIIKKQNPTAFYINHTLNP